MTAGIRYHLLNSVRDLLLKLGVEPFRETVMFADSVCGFARGRSVPLYGADVEWVAYYVLGRVIESDLGEMFRIAGE